jgi:hypothetical protein
LRLEVGGHDFHAPKTVGWTNDNMKRINAVKLGGVGIAGAVLARKMLLQCDRNNLREVLLKKTASISTMVTPKSSTHFWEPALLAAACAVSDVRGEKVSKSVA